MGFGQTKNNEETGPNQSVKCRFCNNVFIKTHHSQLYCSNECHNEVKKEYCRSYMTEKRKTSEYKLYQKNYRKTHPLTEEYKQKRSQYQKTPEHRKYVREYRKRTGFYLKYKEYNNEYSKKYYLKNKTELNKKAYIKSKQKLRVDPIYRLRKNVSNLIYMNLKRYSYTNKEQLIKPKFPYEIKHLYNYLENQFNTMMSWNNYGRYWSIDHKIPLSWCNNRNEIFKLGWNINNLRPLSKEQNVKKLNHYAVVNGIIFTDRMSAKFYFNELYGGNIYGR